MNESVIYAVGTLSTWVGFVLLAWAIFTIVRLLARDPSVDTTRGLIWTAARALAGFVLLAIGSRVVGGEGLHVPIVWIVAPFTGWATLLCVLFIGWRLIGAVTAIHDEERSQRLKSAGGGFLFGALMVFFHFTSGGQINILRGSIEVTGALVGAIAALLIGGATLTSLAARSIYVRTGARTVLLHTTLVAGTVIFGLPFAWLLITSFKEERDMASANGIVWVPRVQIEVPYLDPKEPTVEAKFEGKTVQASIINRRPDDSVDLDIIRPYSLRGRSLSAKAGEWKIIPKNIPLVTWNDNGLTVIGKVIEEMPDGRRRIEVTSPKSRAGNVLVKKPGDVDPYRKIGLRTQNWVEALEYLPAETNNGLVYVKNTLLIVIFSVIGTISSSTVVAYAFARMRFPGRDFLFNILLGTMMLPGAVTLLPQFLIFHSLGWINTLLPIIVPSFFGSAFNVFLLRQFLKQVPGELEDAAKIDGCHHGRILTRIMVPAIMPALAVISIWTFMGAWNNFMGPLIYLSTPENMPLSYALQLFQGERSGEPGLLTAFATMTMLPVLALFFAAQRYFVEGVTLSGLGGR